MIPEEERLQLPEDENSPQKLWAYFNKIAEGEFIDGVMNDAIMRLIQYEPK
uniref:Visinin (Fragments) n=1 Tax=Gallus gallus TaxID=9031 RepID=Q9PSQ4_CHICK